MLSQAGSAPDNPDAGRPGQDHVRAMREAKRAGAEAIGIDADYISGFVDRFYSRIREDDLLGPIFAERIGDWDIHLARMKDFWRSVLHNSGEFRGNPMVKHIAIPGLDERHFAHWLDLFYATLREHEPDPAATAEVGNRARMIADSLLTGIAIQRTGLSGARAGKDLPHV
jgi:hemoglobin